MNKNKVNITQLSLLLLLVLTGGKFLTLPAVLTKDVGHDSWLVLCVAFLGDAVCLCFVLWAIKLNKRGLGLDKILDVTLSKVVSKSVLALFFVIFVCRIMLLLNSCYNTFAVTFDVNINWVLFMLPIVAVGGFAVSRGFNAVARVGQVLFALIFVCVVAILVYPAAKAPFSALLPVCEVGFGKVVGTAFARSFWFSDYIFIYFVLEDITPQKRLFAPILTSFFVGVVLTVLLNAVFVSLFGSFAPFEDLAISKIGMFSLSASTDGRWDWLTLSVWLVSVMLKITIFIFCAYKCAEKLFGLHFSKVNLPVLAVIAALMLLPMFLPVGTLTETFAHWCLVPFALVQYVLPLLMPLLTRLANRQTQCKQAGALHLSEAVNE